MNGIKYLADTNCFIYLLDAHPAILTFAMEGWAYSYITEIELLSKKDITFGEEQLIHAMLATCYKVSHVQEISNLAIQLRRKYNLKLPDALIAASAKVINLPLITADKGFSNIDEFDCLILDL